MKRTFPFHGIIGLFLLILSEYLHFKKVNPFYSWFYCFAWWAYILAIDGVIYWRKGNSLILHRTREFLLMIPWSIFIWLIFESANLSLENWYYIHLPHSTLERWAGYAIAYGTVLPGIFETTEFLECMGLFKKLTPKKITISAQWQVALLLLGIFTIASSVLIPNYFFPLIWLGFVFLLEPVNYRFGGRSLLKDLEGGNPRTIYLLLVAGLICGLLWEFWNFWAYSKWVYTVPFFTEMKGFEMPFLGFLGFLPFAVEAYVMYNFVSLFRFGRGWEESTHHLHPEKKTRLLTSILTGILIASFSVLVFRAIDSNTVDSYEPRLSDAYWIDPPYRAELPKVGILTLDDLLSKTKEKKDRDELALRLLMPREELIQWVERAEVAQLKGLGIDNLRCLEGAGIHSVSMLAAQAPADLYGTLKQTCQWSANLRKARIQIWVREARRVRSSE